MHIWGILCSTRRGFVALLSKVVDILLEMELIFMVFYYGKAEEREIVHQGDIRPCGDRGGTD